MSNPPILRIALPGPLRTLFDYLAPTDCPSSLQAGIRLQVPFGRSRRCGVLIQTTTGSSLPTDRLKPAAAIIDRSPLLSAQDLAFLRWAAEYYQHPLGDVIFHALPLRLRKGLQPRPDIRPGWRLTAMGWQIDPAQLQRAVRQAAVLRTLREQPQGLDQAQLNHRCGSNGSVLRNLQQRQWIEPCDLPSQAPATTMSQPPPPLSHAQQEAVERVGDR
ncbi:MAG: primosomal protein N', partial [Chromatiales bacterium]